MRCLGIIWAQWQYPVPEGSESIYDSGGQLGQRGTLSYQNMPSLQRYRGNMQKAVTLESNDDLVGILWRYSAIYTAALGMAGRWHVLMKKRYPHRQCDGYRITHSAYHCAIYHDGSGVGGCYQ